MCDDFERLLIVEDGDELEPSELVDVVPKTTRDARDREIEKLRMKLAAEKAKREINEAGAETAERQIETLRKPLQTLLHLRHLNKVGTPDPHHKLLKREAWQAIAAALASSEPKENTSE